MGITSNNPAMIDSGYYDFSTIDGCRVERQQNDNEVYIVRDPSDNSIGAIAVADGTIVGMCNDIPVSVITLESNRNHLTEDERDDYLEGIVNKITSHSGALGNP